MIPVEGHKNLFRDEKTNAIINTDTIGYENYMRMRKRNDDKQAEMDALVEKKLREMGKSGNVSRPWDNPDVIAAERVATSPANLNNYESVVPASYNETMSELTSSDRTILSQLDSVGSEGSEANVDSIMQAYLEALIETYTDNLIVEERSKIPCNCEIDSSVRFPSQCDIA